MCRLRRDKLLRPHPHGTLARKFECKPFEVVCMQCEHSHSRTQVPFALRCASCVNEAYSVAKKRSFVWGHIHAQNLRTMLAHPQCVSCVGNLKCLGMQQVYQKQTESWHIKPSLHCIENKSGPHNSALFCKSGTLVVLTRKVGRCMLHGLGRGHCFHSPQGVGVTISILYCGGGGSCSTFSTGESTICRKKSLAVFFATEVTKQLSI